PSSSSSWPIASSASLPVMTSRSPARLENRERRDCECPRAEWKSDRSSECFLQSAQRAAVSAGGDSVPLDRRRGGLRHSVAHASSGRRRSAGHLTLVGSPRSALLHA